MHKTAKRAEKKKIKLTLNTADRYSFENYFCGRPYEYIIVVHTPGMTYLLLISSVTYVSFKSSQIHPDCGCLL